MAGRPHAQTLRADWKLSIDAPLAARVELMLQDPLNQTPIYGARAKLVTALLEFWIAVETNAPRPPLPTVEELRTRP
jgi:hypothetical protein